MRHWIPSIVIALAACSAPPAGSDAGPIASDACVRRTCESAGADCGTLDDGCGGSLECGTCEAHQTCGLERDNTCGGECRIDSQCARGTFCDPARGVCTTECRGPTQAIGVDIAPVRVELAVTLDGAPMPEVSGEGSPPWIALYDEDLTAPAGIPLYEVAPDTGMYRARERIELWLFPGRYRVAYSEASGAFVEHWPAFAASLGTTEVSSDGPLHIDVPRVRATLELSLGGSAPPPGEGPTVRLISDGLAVNRGPLSISSTAWWVPGEYEVIYERGRDGWPLNAGRSLGAITIGEGTTNLDVPRAWIAFDVKLDGAPRPSSGVYGRPELRLVERAPAESDPVRVPLYEDEGDVVALPDPVGAWVLPGTYALYYEPGPRPLEWPASSALLDDALVIERDHIVQVDVRRVRIEASVTLASAAPPAPGCGSVLLGTWDITPSADGEPRSAWMIPGLYDIEYSTHACRGRFDASWPASGGRLGEQLVLRDGAVVVDLPRVRVTVTTTLAGSRLPEVALDRDSFPAPPTIAIVSSGANQGHSLGIGYPRGPWGAAELELYERIPDGAEVTDMHELALIPGSYDVYYVYGNGEYHTEWPSGPALLLSAVEVRSDATLEIDVPRTSVDLAVTLSGGGLGEPFAREDAWWQPSFWGEVTTPEVALVRAGARDVDERASFHLYRWTPEQRVPIERHARWVLPGTYAVRYQVRIDADEEVPAGWPVVSGGLGCWIVP